jgi:hypothetical protein
MSDRIMSAGADPLEVQVTAIDQPVGRPVLVRDPHGRTWTVTVERWLPRRARAPHQRWLVCPNGPDGLGVDEQRAQADALGLVGSAG